MSAQNSALAPRERMLAAIKPHEWQPGVSGNPGGRPKRKPFLEAIEKWITENPDDVPGAIKAAFAQSKKGSIAHLRELMDRVDGPVTQKVEHSGSVELVHEIEEARKRAEE